MQDKARGVGFDWEEKRQVWDKVKEEQQELQAEMEAMDAAVTGVTAPPPLTGQRRNWAISCRHHQCGKALRTKSGHGS